MGGILSISQSREPATSPMPLKQVLCPFSNLGWPAPDQAGFLICKNVPFLRPPPSPARSAPQSLGRRLSKRAHDAWSPTSFFFQTFIQKPSEREREGERERESTKTRIYPTYPKILPWGPTSEPHRPSAWAPRRPPAGPPGPRGTRRPGSSSLSRARPSPVARLCLREPHRCPGKNRENAAASKKGRQYW